MTKMLGAVKDGGDDLLISPQQTPTPTQIAIPNQIKLNCITWNRDQGWIATGGKEGLLKVLKLESAGSDAQLKGLAAPSNLSMNQTLEGHTGAVMCATWNPQFRKLTTSDESGLIIVWMVHKNAWYEEMINNRNKSVVRDMKWTSDGRKICIVYEDGAVIVGSVDGNRLWGKELSLPLRFVEWSPDNKLILFVTLDAEIWVYDSDGVKLRSMTIAAQDPSTAGEVPIVGIHWYSPSGGLGSSSRSKKTIASDMPPTLCVAFENGVVQLSRGDEDQNPVILDTELVITCCKWDSSGAVLAVTGTQKTTSRGDQKIINMIKFYDPYGTLLRNIRIPGESLSAVSWEGSGLRLALAVDSFIFFANVRPAYTWAYLLNTVIYIYSRYSSERRDSAVVFWDQTTGETHTKIVSGLKSLVASGDYCCIVVSEKSGGTTSSGSSSNSGGNGADAPATTSYRIQLRNAIGAIVDTKVLPFLPKRVAMSPSFFVATNDRTVYTWQFQNQSSSSSDSSTATTRAGGKERMFDIENAYVSSAQPPETFRMIQDTLTDTISCITVSETFLVIGRKGGSITRYTLPHLSPENTYNIPKCEPFRLELNCTSSKLALIDVNGIFMIIDLEAKVVQGEEEKENKSSAVGASFGKRLQLERRDVWDIKWAEDNAEMVAICEKAKMVIFRGEVAEEPVASSGYLARFKDLEVRVVTLDELLVHPDQPNKDCVVDFESKSLREAREEIISGGLQAGYAYVDRNPHPRLWRLLAHKALEDLELAMAERAFVRCSEYYGVQLVKQLRSMPDKMKARAEVAVYMGKYDEAESIYREIDRKDLAIQLRKRVGDHMRVVQLLQTGGGNDRLVREAWDRIGEYYADRFKWKKAAQYFQLSRNLERLAECYYRLEDFQELAKIRADVSDGTSLLNTLAQRFESVGMFEEAVDCHVRGGNPKAAVDCCVQQNRWDTAIELAEQHDFPQVEGLLQRYASGLVAKGRELEAVELYRRANRPTEAALLIGEIADKAARRDVKPSMAKKLHVLAALEIERHRKKTMELATQATLNAGGTAAGTIAQATAATLNTLMMTSLDTQGGTTGNANKKASKAFGNAWRGAAAYHFYMLAHRQFYAGLIDASMKTAIKLCEYDDILDPRDIFSLLCVTSLRNKFFGICSRAFVKVGPCLVTFLFPSCCLLNPPPLFPLKLETLEGISERERDEIQTLAVKIFVNHAPTDPSPLSEPYIKCIEVGKSFKACILSGR